MSEKTENTRITIKTAHGRYPHTNGVNSLVLDTHSGLLYSAGRDSCIHVWSPSPSTNNSLYFNELPQFQLKSSLLYHSDWVNDIALCHRNKLLISASSDRSILLWPQPDHNQQYPSPPKHSKLGAHDDYVKCLAATSAKDWVFSGSLDRRILLWDYNRLGVPINEIHRAEAGIYALAASSSGILVHGGPGGVLQLHDHRAPPNPQLSLIGHKDTIRSILINNQDPNNCIISASSDSTVKIWDARAAACVSTLGFESSVWCLENATSTSVSMDVFWAGCRDGSVIKVGRGTSGFPSSAKITPRETHNWKVIDDNENDPPAHSRSLSGTVPTALVDVGGRFDEVEGVDCVLICKEDSPVTKICGVDGSFIWTSTTSSNINRWRDLPFEKAQVVHAGGNPNRDRPLTDLPFHVPSTSIIQQTPNNFFSILPNDLHFHVPTDHDDENPRMARQQRIQSISHTLSKKLTPSVIQDESDQDFVNPNPDEDIVIPLFKTPDFTIAGGPNIIKFTILNNKRTCVCLDSIGDIDVWDILRFNKYRTYKARNSPRTREPLRQSSSCGGFFDDDALGQGFETLVQEYDNTVEHTAEMMFARVVDELNTQEWVGNWCTVDIKCGTLMIHLSASKAFEGDVYHEDCGFDGPLPEDPDFRINIGRCILYNLFKSYLLPLSISRLPPTSPDTLPSSPHSRKASTTPKPRGSTASTSSSSSSPEEANAQLRIPPPAALPRVAPLRKSSLLSGDSLTTGTVLPMQSSSSTTSFYDRLKGHIRRKSQDIQNSGPYLKKKLKKRQDRSADSSDEVVDFDGGEMDSSTLEHLESSSNDNTTAVAEGMEKEKENIDKLLRRNSMGMMPKSLRSLENLNTLPRETQHHPPPPIEQECPNLYLSPSLSITISTDMDTYNCTVGNLGKNIGEQIPMWATNAVLEGRYDKDVPKVGFILNGDGVMELPNGANKLSAHRMLRARKINFYILERITGLEAAEEGESEQARSERLLELVCGDKVIGGTVTLSTIKWFLWKGNGDPVIYYRKRGLVK